ncbi:MAG: UDP-N-acetylmuramoyl-L-alanine--D-glutamate ligase [Pseudomonadaceae bacterium]|nr:UDP-N-acetylmuramoyl-L-alanine--D-glutamate ligase [Pseudomonadaceae bacterium]
MNSTSPLNIDQLSSVAVLGYGVTGESVTRFLLDRNISVSVYDTRAPRDISHCPVEIQWQTSRWPEAGLVNPVDCAIVSPGLDMDACLIQSARAAGVSLYSDIDLFFAAIDGPVIGITGTNGKSTVTSLVGHLINAVGHTCGVGGNLGAAALSIIDPDNECYVLELSSFQLERSLLHAYSASTVLNLSEDHLDKHTDMQAYTASKHRIYANSKTCIYNRADPLTLPNTGGRLVSFGQDEPPGADDWGIRISADQRFIAKGEMLVCPVSQLPLAGEHNEQNVLAACALTQDWVELSMLSQALASFQGLAHRFEQVAEVGGVNYINDSKATNLGATMAALVGMSADKHVVLIAGGDAKGVDLAPLSTLLETRVNHLVALGQDGPQLLQLAEAVGVTGTLVATMQDAVEESRRVARQGDTVLLSPACASLDMFASYVDRGEQFVRAVRNLDAVRMT